MEPSFSLDTCKCFSPMNPLSTDEDGVIRQTDPRGLHFPRFNPIRKASSLRFVLGAPQENGAPVRFDSTISTRGVSRHVAPRILTEPWPSESLKRLTQPLVPRSIWLPSMPPPSFGENLLHKAVVKYRNTMIGARFPVKPNTTEGPIR